jgi:signal transduction histidine kinase
MHDGVAKQTVGSEASDEPGRLQLRLGVVLSEVSRVETVLESSLTFVRPLLELRRKRQRLDAFLADFAELIGGQAQQAGVRVLVDCAEATLDFDPDKLKQALLNLAQNGLYAMPRGGTLRLTGRVRTRDFVVEVNDDGMGMAEGDLSRIKEPYFSRRSGGTGLGVAIANGIVEQHGGTLSFESTPGAGTTARLVLPLSASATSHGEP